MPWPSDTSLRSKLRKQLEEAKEEATYGRTVAPAYLPFREEVLGIVHNTTDRGRWELVLAVTAKVIASLQDFWTAGLASEPTNDVVLRQLDEIIVSFMMCSA